MARPQQLFLPEPRTWGGRRANAGRKPATDRANTPHRTRPPHHADQPLHITLRFRRDLPSLRRRDLFHAIRAVIAQSTRDGFAIVHFSVQSDHLHLIAEARDRDTLSSGMHSLTVRLPQAINRALGRKRGKVLADRYHVHSVGSPRETRNVIAYVLLNWQKHLGKRGVNPCSSGPFFDGWSPHVYVRPPPWPSPVAPARTWLLRVGWRRGGLIA